MFENHSLRVYGIYLFCTILIKFIEKDIYSCLLLLLLFRVLDILCTTQFSSAKLLFLHMQYCYLDPWKWGFTTEPVLLSKVFKIVLVMFHWLCLHTFCLLLDVSCKKNIQRSRLASCKIKILVYFFLYNKRDEKTKHLLKILADCFSHRPPSVKLEYFFFHNHNHYTYFTGSTIQHLSWIFASHLLLINSVWFITVW